MAASVSGSLQVRLQANQTGANDFASGGAFAPVVGLTLNIANGTGAGQADLLFVDERSVDADTNDDIDLAGGVTDAFGNALTFAEVVAVVIINAPISGDANTTALTVGAGSAPIPGFDEALPPLPPGGVLAIGAPGAAGISSVTATSADILRVANAAGGAAVYQIAILGRSA